MLAVATLGAVAAALLEEPALGHGAVDGKAPPLGEVVHAGR
jgi:hypothetical protein